MDKKQLDSILKNVFNLPLWRQVLTDVFGARNLNQTPQPILLPSNEIAENAFELGFFNTTDDRIIGLYQIDLKDNIKIERNKVGLRELLRNIYKTDVDGALVVFVQNDKWRLSFVSEIRVLNDDGTIDKRATEPKRYTYLLGKGEKTKTPTDRLSLLVNKKISLEDIRNAFSVEALNNEFYKQISEYFYQLVGATTTKGKKTEVRQKIMTLPGVAADDRKTYQEFAVRLIGRTVFCWFLREKKSEENKPLLPEKLLSSNAVGANKNYYHEILEPLFFQTLNTPMKQRIEDLPDGCEIVPFLNGGLFEPQVEDFYNAQSKTGSFQNYALKIPDSWFEEFFAKLEEYNFTIDENSPTEVEISVDPEMLGRIFENLLAEIDPDSGETARKATGSFYTPREIVNYMVDESLLIYLKSKLEKIRNPNSAQQSQSVFTKPTQGDFLSEQTALGFGSSSESSSGKDENANLEADLRELFSYSSNENKFSEAETRELLKAIDECKILDPACGSGAFPIGVLQRLVYLLGKLDPKIAGKATKWQELQRQKTLKQFEEASKIEDKNQRDVRLLQISEAFEKDSSDFGRKLFLIENCIYGVDIQPIAAEISKLRCFLTLIVDDTIDETKANRGVNPLPNLEFKFVTADALLKLPASGLFQATTETQMSELEQIRHEYINSYGAGKEAAKRRFKQIQDEIFDAQIKNNRENPDKRAIALSTWNPFGHEKVDWFDALWMFGVKGFDIVIGNPPYVVSKNPIYKKEFQESVYGRPNLYGYFIHRSLTTHLNQNGILSFINPKTLLTDAYFSALRKYILKHGSVESVLNIVNRRKVFESVLQSCIVNNLKRSPQNSKVRVKIIQNKQDIENNNAFEVDKKDFVFGEKESPMFLVAESQDAYEIMHKIRAFKTFSQSGIKFTTGKIQWDLYSQDLSPVSNNKSTRLIWAENIQRYFFAPARNRADRLFINRPLQTCQPIKEETIVVQRTTAIEQKWRIISMIVSPKDFGFPIQAENNTSYLEVNSTTASLKFILSLLSSRLMDYVFRLTNSNTHVSAGELNELPFAVISEKKQKPFENLVDYILFLKETDAAEQVNEYVPNSHLVEQFEEVIDALVYELYFEEDFRTAKIEFLKYAARDFPPIENLARREKIKTVHAAYQTLRQKDNEIRNNLKLMDIRLADLIMPIKTAR